jgi:integrase
MKLVAGHLTLKNGKYYAVLNYKNAGGQRKTKWISLGLSEKGNKRKAESELARLRAEFEPPKEVGDLSSDMLFADYLLEWLEIAKGRLAHATYGAYQGLLKSTIVPYFRKKKLTLRELEARHLQMFYSEMLRRVTPNTVIHYHAVIHSALKYAVKTDMLIQNVADKVDRPRKNSFQPVFLSADEMQKMFEALRGTKLELPVLVAAFYGLRRGEVVGLKWDAIDFEQGTISVKRTVTSTIIDGKYQEFEQQSAKTKSSLRTLPLIGSFREYFMQVKEAQELNKQVCGNCYNYEYDGFVFVDELGERMRVEYLTNAFPKFLESHGLRRMRFHDLRHPYVKHTTKIFSLRLMDFQAQAYPDARRKTRGACQLLRVGQSRSPVRPLCNRKRFSCLPPQSKMSWILYAISMRLSGYTSTRSISSSASSVVSVSASKIALDASMRLSCRACSSCFCFACANTAA